MQAMFNIMPDFLRDPDAFYQSIQRGEAVGAKVARLAAVALVCFTIYGFAVGLAKSPLQGLSSAVKMPILFLSSMAFCLPALYFFSLALLRTPLRMVQVLAVVLSGIAVSAFLLLGLAPITFFFVLTSSNYPFFQLLAVIFVGLSASIGVYFLWRGMTQVDVEAEIPRQKLGRRILLLWILVYAFVGTQMTWRLSPFIGNPSDPFFLIKPSRDNFYVDVIGAIQQLIGPGIEELGWFAPMLCSSGLLLIGILAIVWISSSLNKRANAPKSARENT
ncbi:MAG: hypothetical protein JXA13_11805 [Anaerolineales bacterium]|nr:hypothetical protein [Anaerolineales bacterium]